MRDISEILPHVKRVEWIPRIEYHGENSNDPVFAGYRLYLNRQQEPVEDRWDMKEGIKKGIKASLRKINQNNENSKYLKTLIFPFETQNQINISSLISILFL